MRSFTRFSTGDNVLYLLHPYLNQQAFLEGFLGYVKVFASGFEHFIELTRLHCPQVSPEEERLSSQCQLIQFALFERSLARCLKKKRARRADLTDEEVADYFDRWVKRYGEPLEALLSEYRSDWCRRFEEFEPKAHVLLGRRSTHREHQAKRQAETELEILLQEIEALL